MFTHNLGGIIFISLALMPFGWDLTPPLASEMSLKSLSGLRHAISLTNSSGMTTDLTWSVRNKETWGMGRRLISRKKYILFVKIIGRCTIFFLGQ